MSDKPWCGVKRAASGVRGSWGPRLLTWSIEHSLAPAQRAVTDGFLSMISSICGLEFTESGSVDGANLIYSKARGSRAGFDGPGGTLAYAYMPPTANYDGQLRCYADIDERWDWTTGEPSSGGGVAIRWWNTGWHETGHMLGFDHWDQPGNLMAPIYDRGTWQLHAREVRQWQRVYGPPRGHAPGTVDVDRAKSAIEVLDDVLASEGVTITMGGRSWVLKPVE